MSINLSHFMTRDVWKITESELSGGKKILLKSVKIFLLSLHSFQKNAGDLRATALTMYTVLSIVPIIAMLFGIAKGFGFEKSLKQQLLAQIPSQDTMMIRLIDFAENMLANAQGGVVAGMGIIMLIWTVLKVISMIEEAFNKIWQIKQGRSLSRKLSDYLSLMFLAPILLLVSSSMTVFVSTQITWLIQELAIDNAGSSLLLHTLNYLPMLIMAGLFSFMFIFMPNQSVKFHAGIIAGIITGVIYQLIQWAYLNLQIGVSGYNAIYGSFAALPLFFIWLQLVWMIVLFGCEIAFYIQYYANYQHNEDYHNISFSTQKILALKIMHTIIERFAHAQTALSCEQLAHLLNLPLAIVKALLEILCAEKMLVKLAMSKDGHTLFQPARAIHLINVYLILTVLENYGENDLKQRSDLQEFVILNTALENQLKNITEHYRFDTLPENIK